MPEGRDWSMFPTALYSLTCMQPCAWVFAVIHPMGNVG